MNRTALTHWLVAALAVTSARGAAAQDQPGGPFADAIDTACERVVKVYGGTLGSEKGYGSGVIVSPDGRIVTTLSLLLEGRSIRVVLADGRRFPARVTRRDPGRQLALLEIDGSDLPSFDVSSSAHLQPADWIISAANPFKVAEGRESVSISIGVLSGRTRLKARIRARDFPYDGPVLLTDVIVSSPGAAGGALVDAQGRLVGVIGRAVISRNTNTWVNYALPVEQVAAFLADPQAATRDADAGDAEPTSAADLGIRLFDVGGRVRPAYVERVRPGSPAEKAGIRPGDLIVSADGTSVATCEEFRAALSGLRPGQSVELVAKRGERVIARTVEVAQKP